MPGTVMKLRGPCQGGVGERRARKHIRETTWYESSYSAKPSLINPPPNIVGELRKVPHWARSRGRTETAAPCRTVARS